MSDTPKDNTRQTALNHIAISVTNLAESEAFYRDVIGLKQIEEPFKEGRHAWFDLGAAMAQLHVIKDADERKERDRSNHLCFSTNDLEAFIKILDTQGIAYYDSDGDQGEINIRPDGIKQIFFKDPDGYWLEVNDDHS